MKQDVASLDELDFSILKVMQDNGAPVWKKRAYDLLMGDIDRLPLMNEVSLQTVGRRMDALHNAGFVDSVITEPTGLNRDLIIAFTLTDRGESALIEKRRSYIRDIVRRDIFEDYRDENAPKGPILAAIEDEFGLSAQSIQLLDARFDSVQLASILALYYVERESQNILTAEIRERIRDVARGQLTIEEAITELA